MGELVKRYQESGSTQREFARSNNINLHTLTYWIRKNRARTVGDFIDITGFGFGQDFVIRYPHGVELKISCDTPLHLIKSLVNL